MGQKDLFNMFWEKYTQQIRNGNSYADIKSGFSNILTTVFRLPADITTNLNNIATEIADNIDGLYVYPPETIHTTLLAISPYLEDAGYSLENIDKAIVIDQSPIGRTPRSNPATYTEAFGVIRNLFAALPESKMRGFMPGRFSFNVKGGRCEECRGDGIKKIEMQFLSDVYVECSECGGKRFNKDTLAIKYKKLNIAEVLDLTINQAVDFFDTVTPLRRKLKTLQDVGLGYIKLGQSATTFSGGEAQRIKLAAELSRVPKGHTIYILDEPTTGLHLADIKQLLKVLMSLRDKGNTVLVIEHNLDVIKCADHVIDLGPEGGDGGGCIIAEGTPEQIAKCKKSYTGKYLQEYL